MEENKHYAHTEAETRQRIEDLRRQELEERQPSGEVLALMAFLGICALVGIVLTAFF